MLLVDAPPELLPPVAIEVPLELELPPSDELPAAPLDPDLVELVSPPLEPFRPPTVVLAREPPPPPATPTLLGETHPDRGASTRIQPRAFTTSTMTSRPNEGQTARPFFAIPVEDDWTPGAIGRAL